MALSSLTTREAVQDALSCCVLGLDTNDFSMFASAFTSDGVFDLDGNVMDGLDAIKTGCFDGIAKLDTTHFLSNIRIDVKDGASTAKVSAHALAMHYRGGQGKVPDATRFLTGCLYNFDMVKDSDENVWKIKHWNLKIVWTEGDFGVLTGH